MNQSSCFLLIAGISLVVAVQQHDDGALNTNATRPSVGSDGCSSTCRWQTFGPCQHPDEENNVCFNMTEQMWCPVGSIECGVMPTESGPEVHFVPKQLPVHTRSATSSRTPVASNSAAVSVTPVASSSAAVSVTPVASSSAALSVTPVASSSAAVSVTPVASSSATVSVTPVASSSAAVSVTPVASSSASVSLSPVASSSTSASPSSSMVDPATFTDYINNPNGRLVQNNLVATGVTMGATYEVSFTITEHSSKPDNVWSSVAHFTDGRPCCAPANRAPNISILNGQMLGFFGNDSFRCPTAPPVGTTVHYIMRMESTRFVCIQSYNGQYHERSVDHGGRSEVSGLRVYVANPWEQPADATVTDFNFKTTL